MVKRLVRERRWHNKVKVEVGFVDHFLECDEKHVDQQDIPNLFDDTMEFIFMINWFSLTWKL